MIKILQGKSKEGNNCEVKPSLFANVSLHSVFINCLLELPEDNFLWNKIICQKRQEESEGYCDNDRNPELLYSDDPPYECGLYFILTFTTSKNTIAISIFQLNFLQMY